MSLMGAIFGSGGKSSSTSSSQTDNRRVLGDNADSFEVSGNGKLNQGLMVDGNHNSLSTFDVSTTYTTSTDLGAIKAAQEIANNSAYLGSQVASGALSGAFHFGSDALGLSADAISANGKALSDSLDFGGNAMDLAIGGVSDAYRTSTVNALDFGGNALDVAGSVAKNSTASALNFGGDVFSGALGSVGDALVKALGFGSSALSNSLASSDTSRNQAFGLVDSVVSNSIGLLEDQADAYRKDTASLVDKALAQVKGSTDMLGNAYADSQGRGALTDKMLMVAIGGAVLIAVAAVWRK